MQHEWIGAAGHSRYRARWPPTLVCSPPSWCNPLPQTPPCKHSVLEGWLAGAHALPLMCTCAASGGFTSTNPQGLAGGSAQAEGSWSMPPCLLHLCTGAADRCSKGARRVGVAATWGGTPGGLQAPNCVLRNLHRPSSTHAVRQEQWPAAKPHAPCWGSCQNGRLARPSLSLDRHTVHIPWARLLAYAVAAPAGTAQNGFYCQCLCAPERGR